jgi:phage terminase large subunit
VVVAATATSLDIETAPVFAPLLEPHRYKGARGGRGGAKSWFFGELLVDDCIRQHIRAVCVREVQRSLEQSVMRLLEDVITRLKVGHLFTVKNSWIEAPHDGVIIFQGMKDATAESVKSLEGYNRAWVEETQSLSQRSLDLLRPTIREENSEIWMSWNPRHKTDPVEQFFCGTPPPPDSVLVNCTYKDNPWFPEVLRAEMDWDRRRDTEKYQHIWLGGYEKNSESRVFKNWKVEEFDSPDDAAWMLGADWGFSVDPATMTRVRVDGRKLLIDAEAYMVGCEIDRLSDLFDGLVCGCHPLRPSLCRAPKLHGWARAWESRADSARPETISYLKNHGYARMVPATKGPNSVKEGVIFLQGYDIIIHPRCTHTVDEFTMYSYRTDPLTGTVIPILEDKKNHIIDPVRYAVEKLRNVKAEEFVAW